jgi:tetratricopeptide (TPR) repeat protein
VTDTIDHEHSAFERLRALGRVFYTTCSNWLVGLTPEENHWAKGEAWTRIGAYRWAAWHFRKFLTYSDDPRVRAYLGWCYAQLGMLDSAAQHYREAYARWKQPEVILGLAQVEAGLENFGRARALVQELLPRRQELRADGVAALDALEKRLNESPFQTS